MSDYDFIGQSNSSFEPQKELSPWESYANHRGIITGFIKSTAASDAESLCVLGAGHCYDLELEQLVKEFDRINLVDLSADDVRAGLVHQGMESSEAITVTEMDVSGIDSLLTKFSDDPSSETCDQIIQSLVESPQQLPSSDSVASTCLVSQLLLKATRSIGEEHPRFVEVLQAIRYAHIAQMVNGLNAGGAGILFTDFVSSESLPELLTTTDLTATVQDALANRNFLHGLNPSMVAKVFDQKELRDQLQGIKITDPWRWITSDRIYACFAIVFKKK